MEYTERIQEPTYFLDHEPNCEGYQLLGVPEGQFFFTETSSIIENQLPSFNNLEKNRSLKRVLACDGYQNIQSDQILQQQVQAQLKLNSSESEIQKCDSQNYLQQEKKDRKIVNFQEISEKELSQSSESSNKVISKMLLTNHQFLPDILRTMKSTKTYKTFQSLITSKNLLSGSQNKIQGSKVQLIKKDDRSTVWKVKSNGFDGFLIKKKVNYAESGKQYELENLLKLSGNPFIVNLHDAYKVSHSNGYSIEFFMEFYRSGDLRKKICLQGAFPLSKVKIYAYQIFKGILSMHSQKIMHRNINSSNIFVAGNKLAIGGFGSSKDFISSSFNSCYLGSLQQRSPQLILGNIKYNEKIDIWAAGCVIVEMILGYQLFAQTCTPEDMIIRFIKSLGSPSRQEYISINQNFLKIRQNWKLPQNIKHRGWDKILGDSHLDEDLKDLLDKIFKYNPNERISGLEALAHPYFNSIRNKSTFMNLKKKYHINQDLFAFSEGQLNQKYSYLAPDWIVDAELSF